ncbi:MAG: cytochrome c3 family protein [Polyangiaceae bacterium]|nr:cytochrome c3 family protein [Polyangiaceae bacterium]
MTSKLLYLLGLGTVLALAGCGRGDRTRQPPKRVELPAAPELKPLDTEPEKVLANLKTSVHAKLDCSDCHAPHESQPDKVGKGQCTSCHEKEAKAYAETIHATVIKEGKKGAATCQDCHGMHDTKAVDDPESRVSPRNTPATCGQCHENPEVAKKLGIKEPLAVQRYIESIHGKALVINGLLVAPSCADCHGKAHHIFKAEDPRSTVNKYNVASTCGRCHSGEKKKYLEGIHAKALAEEKAKNGHAKNGEKILLTDTGKEAADQKAPTCPTCHSAHSIIEPGPRFQLANDRVCGKCHEDRLERYLETYHGRAHDLGDPDVAACHDCHGAHDIWPSSNPKSTLSSEHRLATCQQCHVNAPPKFAGFLAHANHADKKNYPNLYWAYLSMTGLLVGTFGFFGIHTLLWLMRTLVERFRDPKAFKEAKARARKEEGAKLYRRFRPIDRFVHLLVIVSFMLLVMTGMPIKFHTAPWAHKVFDLIGGAAVAASVHRFAAIVTMTYFMLHIGSMIVLLRRNRHLYRKQDGSFSVRGLLGAMFGPDSPMPRWQDVKDVLGHMKYFMGRGPKPKFDRFTYWEKFDYMAVFWGVTVIGLSGLVLWFPELATHVMPGWSINVAHIIHSDEALLAAGFIFTFHFFNSHFRPEKFPYDAVMFSGKVTEEELRHERPAQYERMKEAGELENYTQLGEWKQWKLIVNIFGAAAIALGLTLSAAIFYALVF